MGAVGGGLASGVIAVTECFTGPQRVSVPSPAGKGKDEVVPEVHVAVQCVGYSCVTWGSVLRAAGPEVAGA